MSDQAEPGFWRQNRLQLVGAVVMLAVAGGLVLLASRNSGGTAAPPPPPRATATPSPTADPRIGQVKELSLKFLNAVEQSGLTGDASITDQYTVKDSQGAFAAGVNADLSIHNHRNLMVSRVDVIESSWRVKVVVGATVDFDYMAFGHNATWPDLKPLDADHLSGPFHLHLEMEQQGDGRWLIDTLAQ